MEKKSKVDKATIELHEMIEAMKLEEQGLKEKLNSLEEKADMIAAKSMMEKYQEFLKGLDPYEIKQFPYCHSILWKGTTVDYNKPQPTVLSDLSCKKIIKTFVGALNENKNKY